MFAHVCNWVTPCTALRKHFVSPCNTKTLSPSTLNLHPIMPWDSVVLTSLLHPLLLLGLLSQGQHFLEQGQWVPTELNIAQSCSPLELPLCLASGIR